MPLNREYHGHTIISSDDGTRHEVFGENGSIGTHETLAQAIAQAKGRLNGEVTTDDRGEDVSD